MQMTAQEMVKMAMEPTVPTIKKTTDYSLFHYIKTNRPIINKHFEKLCCSIDRCNKLHLYPIKVNVFLEVIDGQHRLKAAERLGVPIYYIIDEASVEESEKMMIAVNSAVARWGAQDYLNYYVHKQYPEYVKLQKLCEKYDAGASVMMEWCNSRGTGYGIFKQGQFKIAGPIDEPLMDAWHELRMELKKTKHRCRNTPGKPTFVAALKIVSSSPLIDRKRLKQKLLDRARTLMVSTTTREYVECILDIYNYGLRARVMCKYCPIRKTYTLMY